MVSETKTTEAPTLRRELKARHLTMIAIGGSIGTGLFLLPLAQPFRKQVPAGRCCLIF
ncbi:Lysine-specific permease [Klebsiella pneumoniae ISC21]|nr:Lysine-specific permease [Klebsiella pneumoniae ISC21]